MAGRRLLKAVPPYCIFLLVSLYLLVQCRADDTQECPAGYNDPGPAGPETLIASYFSVEYHLEGKAAQCRLQYLVPRNASLYQGLIAAHQQHGENFTYECDTYSTFGHHVTSINDVRGHNSTHWALHHGDTWEAADFGVDFLYVEESFLYLWRYTDYSGGEFEPLNGTGDCYHAVDDILPSFELTDVVVYLSVLTESTANFTNGTFTVPMCKQLILTPGNSTLYDVTLAANDQLVLVFSAQIDPSTFGIGAVNELQNNAAFAWRIYDVSTGRILPTDLRQSTVSDGGHYEYKYTSLSDTSPTPTAGRGKAISSTMTVLITLILIVITLLAQ